LNKGKQKNDIEGMREVRRKGIKENIIFLKNCQSTIEP